MIELFIENYKCDVDFNTSLQLNYCIDDIKDFAAKNTSFSKTIILPGTNKNNAIFGNIFEASAGLTYNPLQKNVGLNFNPAIGARALIFQDNIQVFKGVARMMQITIDKGVIDYEVCVFGELGGLVAKLGNKKLEDLDFSEYNHIYNYTQIINSWDNTTNGTGYYYPLIDYGTYSWDKHNYDIRTFRGALFAKEYITKMIQAANYILDFNLINTSRFKRLIIPYNRKEYTRKSVTILQLKDSNKTNMQFSDDPTYQNFLQMPTRPFLGVFNPIYTGGLSNGYKFVYTGTNSIQCRAKWAYDITSMNYTNGNNYAFVGIFKNSSAYILSTTSVSAGDDIYTDNIGFETNYSPIFTLNNGDYITVEFRNLGNSLNTTSLSFNYIDVEIETIKPDWVQINPNEDVYANDLIPQNILQKDFLSSICKLFNLYVFDDNQIENKVIIMPFVDFYANAQTEDWSYKVDRNKPIVIKPMSELNSRYYNFNYKEDSDFHNDQYKKRYNESYGSYKYDSQFEFSSESTDIDLIFSGTPLVGYAGEDKVVSAIFKRTGDNVGQNEDRVDSNIRLLQVKKIEGVSSWAIKDGATTIINLTKYGYAGHLDDPDAPSNDLNFGVPKELFFTLVTGALNVNQFNVYWSSYMSEITDKDSILLTCEVLLKYMDIYNLDFKKFKMIDGVLYRLNKVLDWNATELDTCKVELLKVINKEY